MFKKWYFYVAIFFASLLISGCSLPNPSNPGGGLNGGKSDEELIIDDPDAEEFRVYFNYNDGTDYEMINVKIGNAIISPYGRPREGYVFEGWYKDRELTIPFIFKDEIILESIILYAKWEKFDHPDYNVILDEYVPERTSTNLQFPRSFDEYPGVDFIWSTSDKYTLSESGVVNQGREDITVTVNLKVIDRGYQINYTRDVVVEKINFSPLRQGKIMFGYYSTWHFHGYSEEQLKLDVINVSFAYVTEDFEIDMKSINTDAFLEARKHGVRVVLSVQGAEANSKNFADSAKTEASREKLATNILNVIEKYHFDGVDIDWEYPGFFTPNNKAAEANNYALLMQAIYTKVKAANPDYLVTSAIPGGAEGYKRFDMKTTKAWEYLDYIHLMTYDLEASTKVYHHTALYSNLGKATATQASVNDSIEIYTLQGVPKEKLIIGIAFYGKYTTPASDVNGGLGQNSKNNDAYRTITYTYIKKNYLSRVGDTVDYYFDEICKAPYLYDRLNKVFLTYDDPKSIKEKCSYVLNNELSGVMIWEIGEDETDELMTAVLSGLRRS